MQSVNLLVADRSPDSAEHINSLLRNSGIKIQVIHAASSVEIKRSLDNDAPILILYADADENEAPLEQVAVVHAHAPARAAELQQRASHLLPGAEIGSVDITPVFGVHLGPGAAGFACVAARRS